MLKISRIPIIAALIILVSGCVVNPVTGKKQVSFMSESQEIALGQQSDPAVLAQFGLYPSDVLQNFIEEKGQEMAKISHRSNLKYSFKVVDSPVVNAFAVPGGYVYFTRGIMAHFNNEAQFAGVLGHEIGHIAARHSAQQQTKQMLTQIGLIGAMVVSPRIASMAESAMQGVQLLFLKFSRADETQSDILGVDYSSQIGYNAHEMAKFFKTLESLSGGEGQRLPEFMSTHPDPGRRYQEVNRLTDKWHADHGTSVQNTKINRESYLRMIDGIVYGEDPRQGYVDNNVFYHPELKFEFPLPSGWQYQNSPTQFAMAPEDGKAYMVMTLSSQKTLQAASREVIEQMQLRVQRQQNIRVNGLNAYGMVSDYPQQGQSGETINVPLQSVFIEYGDLIYVFHGMCEPGAFNTYERYFDNTMLGFKPLYDPRRLDVAPERIKIVQANANTTLSQLLAQHNVPSNRYNEFAVLNGMSVNTTLKSGDLIKAVEKRK